MEELFLIIGLGNPGKKYENTRHNIGFRVLRAFAQKNGFSFRTTTRFGVCDLSEGLFRSKKTLLLLPMTYMNNSGEVVQKCVQYFAVSLPNICVVVDDAALSFGKLRLREKGSSGGHNGLESVQQHLSSSSYSRLKVGIDFPITEPLEEYVLAQFTLKEEEKLLEVIKKAVESLEAWLVLGKEAAMRIAHNASVVKDDL